MKRFYIFLIFLSLVLCAQAQEETQERIGSHHAICMYGGGGIHTLTYQPNGGETNTQAGGLFGMEYQNIPKHWGWSIGLQLSVHNSQAIMNFEEKQNIAHTDNMTECLLKTQFKEWEEAQKIMFLELPISLQYQNAFSEKWGIQFGIGLILSTPCYSQYKTQGGECITTGYFESTNIEYEDLGNHGFQTNSQKQSGSIENLRKNIGAQVQLGLNRAMGERSLFYMGIYFQYGLNNNIKAIERPLFAEGDYNGLLGSKQVEKVHPLKFGAKMGFQFGIKNKKDESNNKQVNDDQERNPEE